jgi:preprotein translocase subunit YajC
VSYLPLVAFLIVVIGLLAFSARARRRTAEAESARSEKITVGSEVMTTSGLYGTVVARTDDETVLLSIAPGVEVKWAFAALRDIASLPVQLRKDGDGDGESADGPTADRPLKRLGGGQDGNTGGSSEPQP